MATSKFQLRVFSTSVLKFREFAKKHRHVKPPRLTQSFDEIIPAITPNSVENGGPSNIGLSGVESISKHFVNSSLDEFYKRPIIKELALENNLSDRIFERTFASFKRHCFNVEALEAPLKVIFSDIKQGHSVDLLWPMFLSHARKVFPHLDCIDQLKKVADMTQPHNWYPEARSIRRKFFFHAGPTNSGKTFNALQALKQAKSGIYCGPLRLLVNEVYFKLNQAGTPCDLVTGDDRKYAFGADIPAPHIAITVEMLPTELTADVGVIDEIQMVRDDSRGYAWTRALLGICAQEVHLCGEESAIDIVNKILEPIGEAPVEVLRCNRINPLIVNTHGLNSLKDTKDGDCFVCFDKNSIFRLARNIKAETGRESAIIFGDLPPSTKLAQTAKFNDPENPCKVLVATDAVGMGLNLNIGRIIFTTLVRLGEPLPGHVLHQIAGRAGRYGSMFERGEVTALTASQAEEIQKSLKQPISLIQAAGIAPTRSQLEMFHFLLPHCTFKQLLDVFYSICEISGNFFLCLRDKFTRMAMHLEDTPLSIKDRYTFCIVPISIEKPFLLTCYLRIVKKYSEGSAITYDFMNNLIKHVLKPTSKLSELNLLMEAYDLVGAYLWLSYKMENFFPHAELVRDLENSIDQIINESIAMIFAGGETSSETDKALRISWLEERKRIIESLENEIRDFTKHL